MTPSRRAFQGASLGCVERHRPPRFSADEAARVALERFDVAGELEPLPSERDQNFRVTTGAGERFVLKISQSGEDPALLACQEAMLDRIRGGGAYTFPRPRPLSGGEGGTIAHVVGADGARHAVRLLEWVPGRPLAAARPHSSALLREVGAMFGAIDRALDAFDHPGARRPLHWDPRRGLDVIAENLAAVGDAARRALVAHHAAIFRERATPHLGALREAVIHGDGNDHNVLVARAAAEDPLAPWRVAGLVDFGDVMRTWLAAEPAIAAAYAMLGKRDPLAAAAAVVGGYHAANALREAELAAVWPLALLRLCTSVVLSARQRAERPDNEYLSVSEAPAWALLERLAGVDASFAHYALRDACGLEPCPAAPAVVAWLRAHGGGAAPVLEPDPRTAPAVVFDLSVGSLELDAVLGRDDDAAAWAEAIFGRMRAEGATLGVGRWDEARRWYASDLFRVDGDEGPEWRTVHLGIDLFAEPGAPVFAPLDGTVHSYRDNVGRLDYGPTIVLRHEPEAGGVAFHTLYGHLDPASLDALAVGRAVRRGERIGSVGAPPRNGGWAPHLHFQIVVDTLGREGDFPGVARPSERRTWLSLSPDPNLLLRVPALTPEWDGEGAGSGTPQADGQRAVAHVGAGDVDAAGILDRRRRLLGPSLSVAYRRPLHIVRGWMQHLYDAEGRPYLDAVNNVAHVGHSHPRVVEALRRQAAVLNTNTRYLHETILHYAERLTATLPEPLRVCYFVCSGSEANELALRLARAHTGARDVVVIEGAYHGNTSALVDISPYKFHGPGGAGAPPHVRIAALPDPYRGRYRGAGEEVGRRYADDVRRALDALALDGRRPAAFFAEPLLGCGGQIVPPAGYLAEAFRHVRAAGGVCVADEVQVGFGRVGTHFWAFESQGAVPDIVTLGKPIGNGHPMGAVVTTPEIAASFDNGMEYFNTFGGNPVSCAVGLAVLDVIEAEGLQERARCVGGRLIDGLRSLMETHDAIGDVRGLGLYVGVELVRGRETREPAPRLTAYVAERLRDRGILVGIDGPEHDVLKVKPPLVFGEEDAERLVGEMGRVLGEVG